MKFHSVSHLIEQLKDLDLFKEIRDLSLSGKIGESLGKSPAGFDVFYIDTLDCCLKIKNKAAVVYFERGKDPYGEEPNHFIKKAHGFINSETIYH
jgi:hypothetical protein